MAEFIMLMKGSASTGDWETYIDKLIKSGKFRGGSSLGNGACVSKGKADCECDLTGYIRLDVDNLNDARTLLEGNPLYEAGGWVELLEEIED